MQPGETRYETFFTEKIAENLYYAQNGYRDFARNRLLARTIPLGWYLG
jgi:hypothetical protein